VRPSWLPEPRDARTPDGGVARRERQRVGAGRGDDEPVGRIAVKTRRQSVEREHHVTIEREHGEHPFVRRPHEPLGKRHRQLEAPLRMQDLRFPHADGREAELACFGRRVERGTFRAGER
jgi:hypothetical protein